MLASWKVNATVVTSGPAALDEIWQAFQEGMPIPTVLIEATLPGMDGFEIARLIKREGELAGTRLILMSTLPEKANLANAREHGFDDALSKPIRPSDLLEALLGVATAQPAAVPISLGIPMPEAQGYEDEEEYGSEGERADRILKILIAEDNPVNQAVAAGVLRKRGHKILLANNGAEAVRFFEHEPVDIVLMDLQMPEMDGFTAVKNIRRIETGTGNHVPIIAVTAHAMKGDRERCLASGMDAYLAKPFPKEELVRLVESMALETSTAVPTVNLGWAAVPQAPAPAKNKAALSTKEQLISDLGDDEDLLKTLIQLFLDSTPKLLGELDAALLARNAGALERAAHSLKSSVGNFGAKHAMQLAQSIEFAGKNGELNEASEKVSELHEEMKRVMVALQEML
jgi:CheY-like chemotaxis protein